VITLYDYLPSQNAWKVRLLLNHLGIAYEQVMVSIFEGEGKDQSYRAISPTGTVPALGLADGRALAESNAILMFLADGTPYLPNDAYGRAKVCQWLSFEQERVEGQIGALRHWVLTGKRRPDVLVEMKRNAGLNTLAILEAELTTRDFIASDRYTIADMSLFAYVSRAGEAGLPLPLYPHVQSWIERVEKQPGFLATTYPYSIDPRSSNELP
jgi:glutathione S-transferase